MIKLSEIRTVSWHPGDEDLILELTDGSAVRVAHITPDGVFSLFDEHEYTAEKAVRAIVDIFAEAIEYAREEL